MRDIVIYREAANQKAPFGIILDKIPRNTLPTGNESLSWAKVVEGSKLGKPTMPIDLPQELMDLGLDGQIVPVSISHDKDYAIATALVPTT
jgi:phosphopantetheinyl transferase (holo-ACP synthase)